LRIIISGEDGRFGYELTINPSDRFIELEYYKEDNGVVHCREV